MAQKHFDPPVEFLDLFLPINLSSASRARVFLWIMYHYLSGPDGLNPFDDEYSRANPGRVPRMRPLSREEQAQENIDPADELEWGKRMSALRSKFLRELVDEMEMEKRRKKNPLPPPPPAPSTSYSGESGALETESFLSAGASGSLTAPCSTGDGRPPAGPVRGVRGPGEQGLVALARESAACPVVLRVDLSAAPAAGAVQRYVVHLVDREIWTHNTGCLCRRYYWGGSYSGAHHAEP